MSLVVSSTTTLPLPIHIPDHELRIETARSGGPGGQNVNKVSSKVQLRWCIGASGVVSSEQKDQIRHALGSRINMYDEAMVDVDEERSQAQNRETAIGRLHELVEDALKPKKIRRPTRPTRASKERRLTEKKKVGERKRARQRIVPRTLLLVE